MKKDNDARANAQYMSQWVEQSDAANRSRLAQEQDRKQKVLANQQFLMDQMKIGGAQSVAAASSAGGNDFQSKNKQRLGGMMNPEEARMNRALLQEIARVKRGEEPSDLL